jgi:hypothetical protein
MQTQTNKTESKIAKLNDLLRQTYWGGKVMITQGVQALSSDKQAAIFNAVRDFDNFTPDNDPHGEHDFGTVSISGTKCFWKIDYYDNRMEFGSEDPANPAITTRVLTIMLAEEY